MEAKQNKRLPKEPAKSASALAKVLNEHDERLIKETHETTLKEAGEWLDKNKQFISYHYFKVEFHDSELEALRQGKFPNE